MHSVDSVSQPQRVVIVTGGAGEGIGHGITETLAQHNWQVVVVDRDEERGACLKENLERAGKVITLVVSDVTAPDAAGKTVEAALRNYGRIDALVNNVGVGLTKKAGEAEDAEFYALFNVDFMASFQFTKAVLPELIKNGGSIVNIGSVHARLAAEKYSLYSATKSALEAFTRGLAVDYGRNKVRANIVHPGLIESPQNEALLANLVPDARGWMDEFAVRRQCLPDLATPHDVGELVAFLISPQARAITGQSICIDGGTTTLLWNNEA